MRLVADLRMCTKRAMSSKVLYIGTGAMYDVGFTPINHYTCVRQGLKELPTEPVGDERKLASAPGRAGGCDDPDRAPLRLATVAIPSSR